MIEIKLFDKDHYQIKILKGGASFSNEQERLSDLPERSGVWSERNGVDVFKHWLVPRCDVGEIRRRFRRAEILADDQFWKDVRTWRRVTSPIDPNRAYKGEIDLPLRLFEHQDYFVRIDHSLNRILCPWPTGEGKTIAGLARAKVLGRKRVLVITIGATFDDWVSDARRIFQKEPTPYVGTAKQREKLRGNLSDIVVATYDNAFELPVNWDEYIFDEVDMISNPETRRYQRLQKLINASWRPGRGVQALTATPVGNLPSTAWTIWNLIHPLVAGSYAAFRMRHERYSETITKNFPVKCKDGTVRWLKRKVARRVEFQGKKTFLKKMASFAVMLPEYAQKRNYIEKTRYVPIEMTEHQQEVYKELAEEFKAIVGRRQIKMKEGMQAALRLVQCAEGLFHFDEGEELIYESGKLLFLKELMERRIDAGKTKKIIIWSRFRRLPEILHSLFPEHSVLWNGDLSHDQKRLAKWSFNGTEKPEEIETFQDLRQRFGGIHDLGGATFFVGTMSGATGRGMNLQAASWQIGASTSLSGRVQLQNFGRMRRRSQKAKLLKTDLLYCLNSADRDWIRYVERVCQNMKLSVSGVEQLSASNLRDLAKYL